MFLRSSKGFRSCTTLVCRFSSGWREKSRWVFLMLLIGVMGFGIFSWYRSLYLFEWSPEEERAYRLSRDTSVKFQKDRFEKTLLLLEERKKNHALDRPPLQDLFFGNP
ncbi:MAG: hypothetical protein IPL87_02440 [Candidatus Moraniibacteriota bacterium]|nr:MAG: hypothetical protein IPL87_02440 [Candidatus Moranbacteria bacterium]